jgi:hypothetical protein
MWPYSLGNRILCVTWPLVFINFYLQMCPLPTEGIIVFMRVDVNFYGWGVVEFGYEIKERTFGKI